MNPDIIINGMVILIMFKGVTIIMLIVLIMKMVEKHHATRSADRTKNAIHRQVAEAERRIEQLMAEARDHMFDEVLH